MLWKKRRIWIIALFCVAFVISSILYSVYTYSKTQFRISNYFLSEKAIAFSGKDVTKEIYSKIEEDFVIYNKIEQESDEWMKFSYYESGAMEHPQIISGRFFKAKDYKTSDKLVIVGQDVLKEGNIIVKGKKRYFVLDGDMYLIVGVMGYNFPTVLDRTVFFNMGSVDSGYLYYIDSEKKKTVLSVFDEISQQSRATILQLRETKMNNLVDLDVQMKSIISLLLGVDVASIILAVFFFIKEKIQEIYVNKLLGTSIVDLLLTLERTLVLYLIIAVIFGMISYDIISFIILRPNSIEENRSLLFIFYGCLGSVAGIVCMVGVFFQYIYKKR